ncbi:hypothetical protein BN8_06496 [Fibrisoma limi BUZ 3]|uniref:Uncharacterized protein n=1 Tax=Fibrisoma limi BUZ 3 TaxID=1185876 RepID=I2GT64_9BACT|nr:hypothetical protein [Fibrisoma limi]CCH57093.1 hypothetical protein BN8_06496 [Fibrisoma limi BUZ 3]
MNYKLFLLISLTGLSVTATRAQPDTSCPEAAVQQRPTQWIRRGSSWVGSDLQNISKAMQPQVSARQDRMLSFIRQAYPEPRGLEARQGANINTDHHSIYEKQLNGPLRYTVRVMFHHYWCFRGKPEVSGETGTHIEMHANFLYKFMKEVGYQLPNGQAIYYMPKQVGLLKGYPVYSAHPDDRDRKRESILILPDQRLPVRAVSREELVQLCQATLRKMLAENDETTKVLEASLKESEAYAARIDFKTEAERRKYIDGNRQSVERGRQKRDASAHEWRRNIDRLEQMLAAMTPAERSMQAVLGEPYGFMTNRRGEGTFAEQAALPYSQPLVTHDVNYLNSKLPRPAVQFIHLQMTYETTRDMVAKRAMMSQFLETIDLDGLKGMLEK